MEIFKGKWLLGLLLIYLVTTLMHLPHFGKDIMSFHSWRQTQTQSTINNFYEEDMNIFHPRRNDRGQGEGIKRMEFPLMQWMIAALYHPFGKSVLISRLFVFTLSLFSILGIYTLIYQLFKIPWMALMGAWAFTFSPSFYFYSINPQPDNMALTASIWGLCFFFFWKENKNASHLWWSGLFFSLATLTKLPFIAFYTIPFVYFFQEWKRTKELRPPNYLASFLLITLPIGWYSWVIPQWDSNPIIWGMLDNKDGLSKLLYYLQFNLFSNLPELLLNYGSLLFFLSGFYFLYKRKAIQDRKTVPWIALGSVLIAYYLFEANAIAKVHDYYLFPFLPPLFLLVGYGAYHLIKGKNTFLKYLGIALLIYLPLGCHLRMMNRWNPESPGFNPDLLRYKTELRAAVPNEALVVSGNDNSHCIFFYYINKKGWGFHKDELRPDELRQMIKEGARYLYSDSEKIHHQGDFSEILDPPIAEYGSIRIYKLEN